MNSVFSAFKSNKNNQPVNNCNSSESGKPKVINVSNKKTLNLKDPNNSYEKLRHIREKMMIDDDDIQINLIKRKPVEMEECKESGDFVDSGTSYLLTNGNGNGNGSINGGTISSSSSSSSLTTSLSSIIVKKHGDSENNLLSKCCSNSSNGSASNSSDESTVISSGEFKQKQQPEKQQPKPIDEKPVSPIIKSMPLINDINKSTSNSSNNLPNNNNPNCNNNSNSASNSRVNRPRLSLSNIGGINQLMPSVHGRPNANGQNANGQTRTRLSSHQRNLSLDFR